MLHILKKQQLVPLISSPSAPAPPTPHPPDSGSGVHPRQVPVWGGRRGRGRGGDGDMSDSPDGT